MDIPAPYVLPFSKNILFSPDYPLHSCHIPVALTMTLLHSHSQNIPILLSSTDYRIPLIMRFKEKL